MKFEIAEAPEQGKDMPIKEMPIKVWLEKTEGGTIFLVANGAKLLYFDGEERKLTTWSLDESRTRAMGFNHTSDGCVRVN